MLRAITEEDRKMYLTMCADFYASDAVAHPVSPDNFVRTFDASLSGSPFVTCLMVEWEGETVGYVLLAHTWSQEAGGETVWVEELYILPQHRGRGLGTGILEELRRGYPNAARFRLEVCPDNTRARALYEKMGYTELGYRQMVADYGCN